VAHRQRNVRGRWSLCRMEEGDRSGPLERDWPNAADIIIFSFYFPFSDFFSF
jgi:hypothetical protein